MAQLHPLPPKENRPIHRVLDTCERVLVFDTETTGLSPSSDRIVSYALLSLRWSDLRAIVAGGIEAVRSPQISESFNPGIPIQREAAAIHGITQERAAAFPKLSKEHLDILLSFFSPRTLLIGHNISFDIRMLDSEIRRTLGQQSWWPNGMKYFCTMGRFRSLYPGKSSRLDNALDVMQIKGRADLHHDAGEDVRLSAALFTALAVKELGKNSPSYWLLAKTPAQSRKSDSYIAPGHGLAREHLQGKSTLDLAQEISRKLIEIDGISEVVLLHNPTRLTITILDGLRSDSLALLAPLKWCESYRVPYTISVAGKPSKSISWSPHELESRVEHTESGMDPLRCGSQKYALRQLIEDIENIYGVISVTQVHETPQLEVAVDWRGGKSNLAPAIKYLCSKADVRVTIRDLTIYPHRTNRDPSFADVRDSEPKRIVTCRACGQILRVPLGFSGEAVCNSCVREKGSPTRA